MQGLILTCALMLCIACGGNQAPPTKAAKTKAPAAKAKTTPVTKTSKKSAAPSAESSKKLVAGAPAKPAPAANAKLSTKPAEKPVKSAKKEAPEKAARKPHEKPLVSAEQCKSACANAIRISLKAGKEERKAFVAFALKDCPVQCAKWGTPKAAKCLSDAKNLEDLRACRP